MDNATKLKVIFYLICHWDATAIWDGVATTRFSRATWNASQTAPAGIAGNASDGVGSVDQT